MNSDGTQHIAEPDDDDEPEVAADQLRRVRPAGRDRGAVELGPDPLADRSPWIRAVLIGVGAAVLVGVAVVAAAYQQDGSNGDSLPQPTASSVLLPAATRAGFGTAPSPTIMPAAASATGSGSPLGPRSARSPSGSVPPSALPKAEVGSVTTLTVWAITVLEKGQSVQTDRTRLLMRPDGDLVILDENNATRWRSDTAGRGKRAVFQANGDLVVYDNTNHAVWASGTAANNGAVLVLAADGNVNIVAGGTVIWSSNTAR